MDVTQVADERYHPSESPLQRPNTGDLQLGLASCSMISDPKLTVKVDVEIDQAQNDQDPEADSEEEHVADEPGIGGEHAETNFVSSSWTAQRPGKEEEKEEA